MGRRKSRGEERVGKVEGRERREKESEGRGGERVGEEEKGQGV